jgi:DNA-binding MarR family transcriptional regulator
VSTDPPPDHLVPLLKHTLAHLTDRITTALEPLGIDGREWAVLRVLADATPMSQQEAAVSLSVDRTTMVALVDGLEEKGLVKRRRDADDRRKNVVDLTQVGHDVLRRANRAGEAAEKKFLAPLSDKGTDQLRAALRSLLAAATIED